MCWGKSTLKVLGPFVRSCDGCGQRSCFQPREAGRTKWRNGCESSQDGVSSTVAGLGSGGGRGKGNLLSARLRGKWRVCLLGSEGAAHSIPVGAYRGGGPRDRGWLSLSLLTCLNWEELSPGIVSFTINPLGMWVEGGGAGELLFHQNILNRGCPGGWVLKNPSASAGDMGLIPDPGPTCRGASTTEPVLQNYWNLWALEPVPCEKPLQWEAHSPD